MRAAQEVEELVLEAQHVVGRHPVELAGRPEPERDHHLLERVRRVLRLLEQRHQALAPVELLAGGRVEVGGEHRERLHRAELRQVDLQRAGHRLHGLGHRVATDARDRHTDVDRRALVGREQVGLQEDLAVGDRDDVGRDVGRHVVRLGLDDRQAGHRARAQGVGQLGAALEQAAVQVEDVTGVGLAARRAAQQQRHRAVGLGLLGEVVEDDQDVLGVVHPVLADGRAGVGGEVLEARAVGRRRGHDGGVLEGTGLLEGAAHRGDRRALLADGDVDAADLLLRVAGLPVLLLVDDRVDRDRGLAGRAVADDQLTLAAADRRHRVDGLDAGGQRLVHRLAVHHAGRLQLQGATLGRLDLAEAVDGRAERVDHPAHEAVAHGDRQDLARAADRLALLDLVEVTEDDDADLAGVEVQRDAERAVLELQKLVGHGRGQSADAGDAVGALRDRADLFAAGRRRLVVVDVLLERVPDLLRTNRELRHLCCLFPDDVAACGSGRLVVGAGVSRRCAVGRCRAWPRRCRRSRRRRSRPGGRRSGRGPRRCAGARSRRRPCRVPGSAG